VDKMLFDYFAESVGIQAVATTCIALWIVRLLGDDRVVVGAHRFIKFIDPDATTFFRGPDWVMRPLAAATMTACAVGAIHTALLAVLAAWVATSGQAATLKAMIAFALSMFAMGLCLRIARVSYERAWPQAHHLNRTRSTGHRARTWRTPPHA
jgi:hypothetical protein